MRVEEADEIRSIALSFKDIHVSNLSSSKTIINNISGYVVKGGITAGNWTEVTCVKYYIYLVYDYIDI